MPQLIGRLGVTGLVTIVVAPLPTPKSNQWKPLIYAKNTAKGIGHPKITGSGGGAIVRAVRRVLEPR